MAPQDQVRPMAGTAIPDEEIVERVLHGEVELFEVVMRRYNQRLYRVSRSILRDDAEAEDVMQDAWVRAYEHLAQFAGRAKFSTWLTRIAVHESLARAKRRGRTVRLEEPDGEERGGTMDLVSRERPADEQYHARELGALLETAVERLPEIYRTVFVLRAVEEMNVSETAQCLELPEDVVKTRLSRARGMLRRDLLARFGEATASAFPFMGQRCDRVVAAVLERVRRLDRHG